MNCSVLSTAASGHSDINTVHVPCPSWQVSSSTLPTPGSSPSVELPSTALY